VTVEGGDDPVRRLEGLPQLLLASGQTHPNVLAMMELRAQGYVILHTTQQPPERLDRAVRSVVTGAHPLDEPLSIDAHDQGAIADAVGARLPMWLKAAPGWVFNATAGTKQMVLGVLRALQGWGGLAGYCYVDGQTLYAPDPGQPRDPSRKLAVRLDVEQLLLAHGIARTMAPPRPAECLLYDVAREPTAAERVIAGRMGVSVNVAEPAIGRLHRGSIPRQAAEGFLERYRAGLALPASFSPSNFVDGWWLEHRVFDILERNRASLGLDDVRWSVKLHREDELGRVKDVTDLDVCFTASNRFFFVSCKTSAADGLRDEVYEVEARKRQVGGGFGAGILVHWHPETNEHARQAENQAHLFGVPVLDRRHVENERELCSAIARVLG
jgi:hypothetical protein